MEKNCCLSKLLSCSSAAFRLFPRARQLTVKPLYLLGKHKLSQTRKKVIDVIFKVGRQTFLPAPQPAARCLQLSPSSRCSPGESTSEDDGSEEISCLASDKYKPGGGRAGWRGWHGGCTCNEHFFRDWFLSSWMSVTFKTLAPSCDVMRVVVGYLPISN